MKVVICWPHVSGYTAACWRALAAREGVQLHVIAFAPGGHGDFAPEVMHDLSYELLDLPSRNDAIHVRQLVSAQRPDMVVIPGWLHRPYLALMDFLPDAAFVMGIDTSFTGSWRQQLGRLKVGAYIDRCQLVVVAGERAFQLARSLKVPEQKILRGVYGYDDQHMAFVQEERLKDWPHSFLFVGRYVLEKALDVLMQGYTRYRQAEEHPWPLTCCGSGPLIKLANTTPGVTDAGFLQPSDLPRMFLRHGAFVFVSRFEPWGVALAEAMASGMPAICSEAVGASVELVRHRHNGLLVPTENADAIAEAMRWMHYNARELPEMGRRAREHAVAFTAERWADRWLERLTLLQK